MASSGKMLQSEGALTAAMPPSGASMASIWGSHACRSLRMDPPSQCVEGETELLIEMRTLLGPFASEKRLLSHLRAVRGKVNWAANRYLREELMAEACPDFYPKPPARPSELCSSQLAEQDGCEEVAGSANQGSGMAEALVDENLHGISEGQGANGDAAGAAGTSGSKVDWLQLPDGIMLAALCQLGHQDLCQVASSCKWLRDLAYGGALWKALYEQRWGRGAMEAALLELQRGPEQPSCRTGAAPDEPPATARSPSRGPLTQCPPNLAFQQPAEPLVRSGSSGVQSGAEDRPRQVAGPEGRGEEGQEQWRRATNGGVPGGMVEAAKEGGWRGLFQHRLACERATKCPECREARFVPIVYGFPSGRLVDGLREERLVLGGDHLIDYPFSSPLWACLGCGSQWRTYPYSEQSEGPFSPPPRLTRG